MTKVIFRKFSDGEVIALFPEMPGIMNPATCQSYVHYGQHGSASAGLSRCTKPAKESEYAGLLRELVSIGYDDLKICQRFTRGDYLTRRREIDRV